MYLRGKNIFFRITSIVLIISILSLNVTWAYPADLNMKFPTGEDGSRTVPTLAARLITQSEIMDEEHIERQAAVLKTLKFLIAIEAIAKYLFKTSYNVEGRLEHLPGVMKQQEERLRRGLHRSFEGRDFPGFILQIELEELFSDVALSHVEYENGIIRVPCFRGGEEHSVNIALRNSPEAVTLKGHEIEGLSDKYKVTFLPRGYTEPAAETRENSPRKTGDIEVLPLTRDFAEEHADELLRIFGEIKIAHPWTRENLFADEKLGMQFLGKWDHSFVATDGKGRPIGILIAYEREKDKPSEKTRGVNCISLYINILSVEKEWQARGVGQMLMRKAARNLMNRGFLKLKEGNKGVKRISVSTVANEDNYKARRFYKSMGFKKVGYMDKPGFKVSGRTQPPFRDDVYIAQAETVLETTNPEKPYHGTQIYEEKDIPHVPPGFDMGVIIKEVFRAFVLMLVVLQGLFQDKMVPWLKTSNLYERLVSNFDVNFPGLGHFEPLQAGVQEGASPILFAQMGFSIPGGLGGEIAILLLMGGIIGSVIYYFLPRIVLRIERFGHAVFRFFLPRTWYKVMFHFLDGRNKNRAGYARSYLNWVIGPKSREPLLKILKNEKNKASYRARAVNMLGEIPDNEIIKILINCINDRNHEVCIASANALLAIGDKRAVEPLQEAGFRIRAEKLERKIEYESQTDKMEEVAGRLIADFDDIMQGVDEYRVTHASAAIEIFQSFRRGRESFEFLFNIITSDIVKGKTPKKEEYFKLLDRAYAIYRKLDRRERAALFISVILHDVGFNETTGQGYDHWEVGARMVEPMLKHYGLEDEDFISNVRNVVRRHSKIADIGIDMLPLDFVAMPRHELRQIFLLGLVDNMAKRQREAPYRPDNILSTQFLREQLNVFGRIRKIPDKIFLEWRLRCAGVPRGFQLSREGLELTKVEQDYLNKMAGMDPLFKRVWTYDIRNKVFPLFQLILREGGQEGLARAERIYKFMLLLALIVDARQEQLGRRTVLTIGTMEDGFGDNFFKRVLKNMDEFFKIPVGGITGSRVRLELKASENICVLGLPIVFSEDKILLREPTANDDIRTGFMIPVPQDEIVGEVLYQHSRKRKRILVRRDLGNSLGLLYLISRELMTEAEPDEEITNEEYVDLYNATVLHELLDREVPLRKKALGEKGAYWDTFYMEDVEEFCEDEELDVPYRVKVLAAYRHSHRAFLNDLENGRIDKDRLADGEGRLALFFSIMRLCDIFETGNDRTKKKMLGRDITDEGESRPEETFHSTFYNWVYLGMGEGGILDERPVRTLIKLIGERDQDLLSIVLDLRTIYDGKYTDEDGDDWVLEKGRLSAGDQTFIKRAHDDPEAILAELVDLDKAISVDEVPPKDEHEFSAIAGYRASGFSATVSFLSFLSAVVQYVSQEALTGWVVLAGAGIFYFGWASIRYYLLGRATYKALKEYYERTPDPETFPETSGIPTAWQLRRMAIALSRGYRHPAFENLSEKDKKLIELHESFKNHFAGMLSIAPIASFVSVSPGEQSTLKVRELIRDVITVKAGKYPVKRPLKAEESIARLLGGLADGTEEGYKKIRDILDQVLIREVVNYEPVDKTIEDDILRWMRELRIPGHKPYSYISCSYVKLSEIIEEFWDEKIGEFLHRGEYPFNYEEALITNNFPFVEKILEGEAVLPPEVEILPTSRCNLKCNYCIGQDKKLCKHFDLSEEDLIGIIDDIHQYNQTQVEVLRVKRIRFAGITGEPLLNPATAVAMEKAIQYGFEVGLVTNGALLDENARKIIVNGKYVHVSFDAATSETFSRLKDSTGEVFKRTIENIRGLVSLREKLRVEKYVPLEIGLGFVLTPGNYHEVLAFAKMAKKLGVDYVRFRAPEGVAAGSLGASAWEGIRSAIGEAETLENRKFKVILTDETKSGTETPDLNSCPAHALLTIIGPQGSVHPCPHVTHKKGLSFGNIRRRKFLDIWKGRTKKAVIEKVLVPRHTCPACPPRAARINKFLHFLIDQNERNPIFLAWFYSWMGKYKLRNELNNGANVSSREDKEVMSDTLDLAERERQEGRGPIAVCLVNNDTGERIFGTKQEIPGLTNEYGFDTHAEINAFHKAVKRKWDLSRCTLYGSLESCYHCAKATISHYRVRRVVSGCPDPPLNHIGMAVLEKGGIPAEFIASKELYERALRIYRGDKAYGHDTEPSKEEFEAIADDPEISLKRTLNDKTKYGDEYDGPIDWAAYLMLRKHSLFRTREYPHFYAVDADRMHAETGDGIDTRNSAIRHILRGKTNTHPDRNDFRVVLLGEAENCRRLGEEIIAQDVLGKHEIFVLMDLDKEPVQFIEWERSLYFERTGVTDSTIEKIVKSPALSRLKGVCGFRAVLKPGDEEYSRYHHVMRVREASRLIAAKIGGGVDAQKVEAIALLHDIGQLPFANLGQKTLREIGFDYKEEEAIQTVLRNSGINVPYGITEDLIKLPAKDPDILSREGRIVLMADRLVGKLEDILFALEMGVLKEKDIQDEIVRAYSIDDLTVFRQEAKWWVDDAILEHIEKFVRSGNIDEDLKIKQGVFRDEDEYRAEFAIPKIWQKIDRWAKEEIDLVAVLTGLLEHLRKQYKRSDNEEDEAEFLLNRLTVLTDKEAVKISSIREDKPGEKDLPEADSLVAAIITLAQDAETDGRDLILGFETDWIPGYNNRYLYGTRSLQYKAIYPLIRKIEGLEDKLADLGFTNVKIVHSSSKDLARDVINKAGKADEDLSNVIVFASEETINSASFKDLRQKEESERPFFAGVDAAKIIEHYEKYGDQFDEQLFIDIIGMFYLTLELALGKQMPDLPIIRKGAKDIAMYENDNRIVIFLPRAVPMDCNLLRERYRAKAKALESA